MKSRKSNRKQKGGRNDLSYVLPSYSMPSTSAGNNTLVPTGQIVRPSIQIVGGSKSKRRQRGGHGCGGLPFPIASRNISRNEPLYPAIHARLIGGANRTYRADKTHRIYKKQNNRLTSSTSRKYKGGFSPAIMGPLIDNFHYIAPAVGLVAYRYYDQIKGKFTKGGRKHRRS